MQINFSRRAVLLSACTTLALGCATSEPGEDAPESEITSGNDCFWASSIYDFKAISNDSLIVWSPSRQCPYRVDLTRRCDGLRFADDLGFDDRDGRICPFGGDAVVVPGLTGDRCTIRSIKRLNRDELARLVEAGVLSEKRARLDAGVCGDTPDDGDDVEDAGDADDGGDRGHDFAASEPMTWGAADNVVQVGPLYVSRQPDVATLEAARDAGVTTVINLRGPDEMDWDEAAAVRALGLQYYNVPITGGGPSFDAAAIDEIGKAVAARRGGKVLMHCRSGNRAAAWLAVHLANDHDLPVDEAISIARDAGLTYEPLESRVRSYVGEASTESPPATH